MASLDATLDTAATVTHFVGDAAKLALTIGQDALPIVEFLAPWIPGVGPVLADIQIALPIIKQVATYAPAVQSAIQNGKPMIEAVAGIGAALLDPLKTLLANSKGISVAEVEMAMLETFLAGGFKRSFFDPQDPRFRSIGDQ